MNRYAYTRGDPINRYDPRSLDDTSPGSDLVACPSLGGTLVPDSMCPGTNNPTGPYTKLCSDGSVVDESVSCPYEAAATDPPNKGGWATNPRVAARTGWQYLTSIWNDCLNYFTQDQRFDSADFKFLLTNGINWYDTRGSDGAGTVDSIVHNGDPTTLRGAVGGGNAVVLGTFTNHVALGTNFFSDNTQTTQVATTIHEALHVQMKMGDPDLKGWLTNFGFAPTANGTSDITDWIEGGCKKH